MREEDNILKLLQQDDRFFTSQTTQQGKLLRNSKLEFILAVFWKTGKMIEKEQRDSQEPQKKCFWRQAWSHDRYMIQLKLQMNLV